MSMLVFMPWCRLNKRYQVGEITLLPFELDKDSTEIDTNTANQVSSILSSYKDLEGQSIKEATLVIHKNDHDLNDLSDAEVEEIHECAELVAFLGLSNRAFFALEPYCNTDCFILYIQKINGSGFTSITSRRRDGRTLSVRSITNTLFTIPLHVSDLRQVSLDEKLLASLLAFRSDPTTHKKWPRWQNAISCFNQANTDNDTIRYQTEWVNLCSAFEHILEAKSNSRDVAQKFVDAFTPQNPLAVNKSTRIQCAGNDLNSHLRYRWMKEFYRIRGDFAHGKLQTQKQTKWKPLEHIVLGAIAFPLLVRCLLKNSGNYVLNNEDQAQINAFEALADNEKFLDPPTDQHHPGYSVWSNLVETEKSAISLASIKKEIIDH